MAFQLKIFARLEGRGIILFYLLPVAWRKKAVWEPNAFHPMSVMGV